MRVALHGSTRACAGAPQHVQQLANHASTAAANPASPSHAPTFPLLLLLLLLPFCCPQGVPNNVEFLRAVVADPRFKAGDTTTRFLEGFHFVPHVAQVITPGGPPPLPLSCLHPTLDP